MVSDKKMKPLESPFRRGDMVQPATIWWYIPIVSIFVYGTQWRRYFRSLKTQIEARGPVPDDAWGTAARLRVAREIEGILQRCCWREAFTFHPSDPYAVVGEFEVGDLSEVEALMQIEERFGVKFPDSEMESFLQTDPTFGDFIGLVMAKAPDSRLEPKPDGAVCPLDLDVIT